MLSIVYKIVYLYCLPIIESHKKRANETFYNKSFNTSPICKDTRLLTLIISTIATTTTQYTVNTIHNFITPQNLSPNPSLLVVLRINIKQQLSGLTI